MTTLSSADKQQLEALGISAQQVENQIVQFKNGFAFSDLIAPATIGKGIVRFNENEIKDLVRQFDEDKKYYDIIRFKKCSEQKIYNAIELKYGPYNIIRKEEMFLKYINDIKNKKIEILNRNIPDEEKDIYKKEIDEILSILEGA